MYKEKCKKQIMHMILLFYVVHLLSSSLLELVLLNLSFFFFHFTSICFYVICTFIYFYDGKVIKCCGIPTDPKLELRILVFSVFVVWMLRVLYSS